MARTKKDSDEDFILKSSSIAIDEITTEYNLIYILLRRLLHLCSNLCCKNTAVNCNDDDNYDKICFTCSNR